MLVGYHITERRYFMFYIGIDVGKFNHCCAVVDDNGVVLIKPFFFTNNEEGFHLLLSTIKSYKNKPHLAGLESTGHYGDNLIHFLLENKYSLGVINPISTDAHRKTKIRKTKNDKIDAVLICQVLMSRQYSSMTKRKLTLRQGKQLSRYHQDITSEISSLKNKLTACIDIVFPEFNKVFATNYSKMYLAVLKEFGSSKAISNTPLSHLKKVISKAARGNYRKDIPALLKETAKHSIGEDNAILVMKIKQYVETLQMLVIQLKQVDKKIEELATTLNSPIFTIPGIGSITGVSILCEFQDIHQFSSSGKMTAFAGMDPSVYQSGNFNASQTAISKRGSSHLRLSLYQVALTIVRFNTTFNTYYNLKISQGKSHRCAQGAVIRKLIRVIYKLETENISFDLAYSK